MDQDQGSDSLGARRADESGYGDDQGTKVGAPDQSRTAGKHSDSPPARPERQTGTGGEATEGTSKTGEEHDGEHRSGYGGSGGDPVSSSDQRK
jgi:hypothetical protein